MFAALTTVGWALPIIVANITVPLAIYLRRGTGFRLSGLWLITLLTDTTSLLRAATLFLEVRFLDKKEAIWIQQIWANSFLHRSGEAATAGGRSRAATLSDRAPTFILKPSLVYAFSTGLSMLALLSLRNAKFDPPWDREDIESGWWVLDTVTRIAEAMCDRKWSGVFYVLSMACVFEFVSRIVFLLVYLYSWYRIRDQLRERKPGGPMLQHEVWRTFFVLFWVFLFSVLVSETVAAVSVLTSSDEDLTAYSRRNMWIMVGILIPCEVLMLALLVRICLVTWRRMSGPPYYRQLQRWIERYRRWREAGPGPIQLAEDT